MIDEDHPLRRFADPWLAGHVSDPPEHWTTEAYLRARERADIAILDLYGLPPYPSELTIARRLLDLNESGAGAE